MKQMLILFFISNFSFTISSYGQNKKEILMRNKVKHITITNWTLDIDGNESPDGFPRVEEDYDTLGNLIERISFVSYRENKNNRDTYKYDERNHLIEHSTYAYVYFPNDSIAEHFIERYAWRYDDKNNLVYESYKLNENPNVSDKECNYIFKYNDKGLPMAMESKCKRGKCEGGFTEKYTYKYDKLNNLTSQLSDKTEVRKIEIKYFKDSNKIQERVTSSGERETFDVTGKVIKKTEGTITKYFKYNSSGNLIERFDDDPTNVFTYHYYFTYDNNSQLVEASAKNHIGEVEKEKYEKLSYDIKQLLSEYIGKGGKKKYKYILYE
jgi:hypothetical protein